MADEFKLDLERLAVEQNGGWAGGLGDWIGAFGRSAVESIPELVGISPSSDTLKFRADSPVAGFVSQLAGMAVPYGGWLRGARLAAGAARATGALGVAGDLVAAPFAAIPGAARIERMALAAGEKALEAPFMSAAKAEAIRLAPFEIGRTLVSQVVGDKSLPEMAFDAGINLALGSGVAGAFGRVGAMAKVAPRLSELVPGLDETLPPQLLLRKIDELATQTPPEGLADLLARRADIDALARTETPYKGHRYVDPAIDAKEDHLERLFSTERKWGAGYVDTLLPTTGEKGFAKPEDWQDIFRLAGVEPQAVGRDMQFPRVLKVNPSKDLDFAATAGLKPEFTDTLKKAANLEETIAARLAPVGDGWHLAREPQDGMYVLAKKVVGEAGTLTPSREYHIGQVKGKWQTWQSRDAIPAEAKNVRTKQTVQKGVARPGIDDTWILFKTDKPGDFVRNSQAFMNTAVARERWLAGAPALENIAKGTGAVAKIAQMPDTFPLHRYADLAKASPDGVAGVGAVLEKIGPKALPGNQLMQTGAQFIKTYLTPADRQFWKNARANWAHNMGRAIQEAADTFHQNIFQGPLKFSKDRAVLSEVVGVPGGPTNLTDLWSAADKEGLIGDLMRLRREEIPAAGARQMAAEGKIHPRSAEIAEQIEALTKQAFDEQNLARVAAGKEPLVWREGEYGLSKTWEGDYLHLVRDEGGNIAGVASSGSTKGAQKKAEALAKSLSAQTGGTYRLGEAFGRYAAQEELPRDAKTFLQKPEAAQFRGFKWDTETPTLQDILNETNAALSRGARHMGADMREATLGQHLAAVQVEDPTTYKNLRKRFDLMEGKQGEFAQAQNRVVDKVLSPLGFGSNTASKIAAATNTGLAHIQLGAFKLSYPLQNIVGAIQQIAPELAMVMNASESDLAIRGFFKTAPAVGAQGIVGSVSTLDPIKMLGQGVRMMWKPSAEERTALEWALNHRVVDARVAEDFIGQNRRSLSNWKGALNSPRAFADFTLALSEWLMVHSERFARTLAFSSGYRTARSVMRLPEDEAFHFARRITERTNYLYSSADRPLVFTSPLGSSLGLFKNWQTNFIHSMVEYAGLGVNKNVWSPILWQTISTAAIGGAAATPLYWAANGAANLLAQKKLIQYAYDEFNNPVADGVMFGLPAALTGVSLSSLMTEPGANPVKDATQLFSFAVWSRMKEAGGAVHAAMDNWRATGQHPASDPDVRNRLVKAFAPVLIQRAMSIDDGTVKNISTGLPTAKGLTTYDRVMYQMGLQPVILERQQAASEALYEDREKMKAATSAFGDALAEAMAAGNSRALDLIAERAVAQGVDLGAAFRSAGMKSRLEQKTSAERLAKPALLEGWKNVRGVD